MILRSIKGRPMPEIDLYSSINSTSNASDI